MTIKRYAVGETIPGWPVDSWDQLADHAERDHGEPFRTTNGVPLAAGIFLLVKPTITIEQRGIVTIGSIYRDPNDESNKSYLQQSPVFFAAEPAVGDKSPGVAFESIEGNGSPGWVMVSGVAWATVNITDEDHDFCEVVSGDTTKFTSAESGIAIKWKPSGTGEKICAVLLCLNTEPNEPAGAPLNDPPTASGSQDTGTPGDLGLDATSTPDTGLSITAHQWVLSLPSSHSLVIAGNDGSVPNFVYDSRGTLDLTDVGGIITGNIEALTIDETGASISGPYTVSLTSTQSDDQTDTASIT